MQSRRTSLARRMIVPILAAALLGGGLYLLYVTLSPLIAGFFVDPDDNTTTQLLARTEEKTPQEPRLYIPKIDVNVPYATGDETVMEHGAWWRQPSNGNPVDGGNFVLSAHRFIMGVTPEQTQRKSPFYHINKLVVGDELIVDYESKRYVYEISEIFAVKPTAIEIEDRTDDARLTLYSCTLGGAADGREVIIARLRKNQTTESGSFFGAFLRLR